MNLDCRSRKRRITRITRRVVRITVDGRDLTVKDIYKIDTRRKIVGMFARDANGKYVMAFDDKGDMTLLRYEFTVRGNIRLWLKGRTRSGVSKCGK